MHAWSARWMRTTKLAWINTPKTVDSVFFKNITPKEPLISSRASFPEKLEYENRSRGFFYGWPRRRLQTFNSRIIILKEYIFCFANRTRPQTVVLSAISMLLEYRTSVQLDTLRCHLWLCVLCTQLQGTTIIGASRDWMGCGKRRRKFNILFISRGEVNQRHKNPASCGRT